MTAAPEPGVVLVDGPWKHRDVSANGTRFHVAEAGEGPLILLLHGFPEFWWTWRHQLPALAELGFRVVAADLRGYGASDKPPRGYDAFTLSADVAGLVRALGERDAVLVGHDWGGFLAWTAAVLHPQMVRGIAVLSMPHPLLRRRELLAGLRGQEAATRYVAGFQVPWRPERRLVADDAAYVGELLRGWGGPGFPDGGTERRYREAMQILGVPFSSLEYYRWALRSTARPDGRRLAKLMERPVEVPTLQLHGALDTASLLSAARGSGRWVRAPYRFRTVYGTGHFPHEEMPGVVTGELTMWLGSW